MKIDVDSNGGDECCIYQIYDDSFYLVVRVVKAQVQCIRRAIESLRVGDETLLGTIGCGERVWVCRDDDGHGIAIGDTDGKDVWVRVPVQDISRI